MTKSRHLAERRTAYLLTLPAFAFIIVILAFPLLYGSSLSLFYKGNFAGLKNYVWIIKNKDAIASIWHNIILMIACLTFEFVLGFCFALLLNQDFKGRGVFRALFMLPLLVAPVVCAFNWRFLLNDDFGTISKILRGFFGIHPPLFLATPKMAFISIIFATIWRNTPTVTILLLAGLQAVDVSQIESATMDGANGFQRFRYITIPSMKLIILFTIMLRIIDLYREFDLIWVMTTGGPGGATEVVTTKIYKLAFFNDKMEISSALSVIAIILTLVLLVPFAKMQTAPDE